MYSFLLSLIIFIFFAIYKSKNAIHMLQQNYYNLSNRYFFWMTKNIRKVLFNVDILFLSILFFLFVEVSGWYISIFFAILYIFIFLIYYLQNKKQQCKIPLKITSRVKRIIMTELIVYLVIITTISLNFVEDLIPVYYLILGMMSYFSYLLILFVNFLNKPIEYFVYLHYKRKALKKLKDTNIPVIGITGSYGKTSSKNILNDILNVKYNSFATPKSFNTPNGMILSINNYLDKFNDYFIAEMGAFKVGEIKKLCQLVNPTYGILTTIGDAHLESFGNHKNIQKTKFELIESLPEGGIAILNGDDKRQTSYQLQNKKCEVLWISIDKEGTDAQALNIELTKDGTSFDVKFKDDDQLYHFQSHLLGKHNVYNMLDAILLGRKLGMNYDELKRGVAMCHPTEHRLEIKKIGDLNIIDDAYNSNPTGAKRALEVLRMMPGTRIIVTPGMIELGDMQYDSNKRFGEQIALSCDYVVLVGKEQTKPIYDGLMVRNYKKEKIFVTNQVSEAFTIIKKLNDGKTYVLLENDLPDLFNE